VLECLILARITQSTMHRLHGLPLAVVEQPVEILRRGLPVRLTAEAGAEHTEELAHASQQRPRGPRRHDRSVRNSARQYKCNLIERCGLSSVNLTK
jgi:hypothetical protein